MIPILPFKMFLFFLSITSHYLLGIVNVDAYAIKSSPKLFLGYSYIQKNLYEDEQKKVFKLPYNGLKVQPSPAGRQPCQLISNEFYELEISVDQDAFDTLNYIYADEQANVEEVLRNHQMIYSNTVVVRPTRDSFGVPHSMKDLEFLTIPDGTTLLRLPHGKLLQFHVSSILVASATSQKVADWSKWKGGIKDLPPHLASNLQ